MSDTQKYEGATVSSDGLTVAKRFEEDEFPVPAIAFEIQSNRSETVTITLIDEVPGGVAVEDLGFHPEYGSEYWTIEEEEITFEREIEAGSEYTTVYGIRATGTDDVKQFLGEPRLESVHPPLEDASGVVENDGSDVVRDVISGDSDTVPGLDDEGDDDIGTLDLKDPKAQAEESSMAGGDDDEGGRTETDAGAETRSLDEASVESLTGALADELRNGEVEEEDVKLLRKAFDLAAEESGSTEARIKRLQTEVADLLAYTDALEEFLDEHGTGDEMIEEFREQVESFESELDEVRSTARGQEETVASLEASVESVQASVADLESDVESALVDVESVENEVDEMRGEITAVGDDVEDLEERVGNIDVGELEDQLSDIEADIADLKDWRDQLSSVIGG